MKDFDSHIFAMFPFYTTWNYPRNLWFSDVFREYEKGTLGRNKSSFLTHFSPLLLFCTPCEREKTLGLLLFPGSIKSEHWEEMGEIMSSFILLFTQLKNSFFQWATFINCFRVFKWIVRESRLHRVHGVQRQAGIGVQINNQQTQGSNNLNSTCLHGNCLERYQENIHNRVEVKLQNLFSLHFI